MEHAKVGETVGGLPVSRRTVLAGVTAAVGAVLAPYTARAHGHLAFETGVRVARHIADRISHGQAEASLNLPSAICFASFSETEAMGVNVTAEWDELLGEVKRAPVVDPARSSDALERADAWSGYVWAELLG
jgi:hypothetical protein